MKVICDQNKHILSYISKIIPNTEVSQINVIKFQNRLFKCHTLNLDSIKTNNKFPPTL